MNLIRLFDSKLKEIYPNGVEWDLVGLLTKTSKVYTLSHDSKILSGLFEILCEPIIVEIAKDNKMAIAKGVQTQYPEFTLYKENKPKEKIAIDVKSTYRKRNNNGSIKPFAFTLGSYRSYLKDGKSGILFPYKEYSEHWVIGFIYDRNEKVKNIEIKNIIEAAQLEAPYKNIEYFVQEKYKIAGTSQGSGNTTNIGSIKSNDIDDFKNGNGIFKSLKEFETYWKNF